MKKQKLIWRTVRGSRIGIDAKTGEVVIAPKWFKEYLKKKKTGKTKSRKR